MPGFSPVIPRHALNTSRLRGSTPRHQHGRGHTLRFTLTCLPLGAGIFAPLGSTVGKVYRWSSSLNSRDEYGNPSISRRLVEFHPSSSPTTTIHNREESRKCQKKRMSFRQPDSSVGKVKSMPFRHLGIEPNLVALGSSMVFLLLRWDVGYTCFKPEKPTSHAST